MSVHEVEFRYNEKWPKDYATVFLSEVVVVRKSREDHEPISVNVQVGMWFGPIEEMADKLMDDEVRVQGVQYVLSHEDDKDRVLAEFKKAFPTNPPVTSEVLQ